MTLCIRWAFRIGAWQPSRDQWILATRCIQPEEKQRIGRFVFQKDAKSALAGRLLLRKVIHERLHIPYTDIHLGRTSKGKPYLIGEHQSMANFSFNISHQGGYAVLAAEDLHQVGVDVMQVEYPRGSRTVEDFFTTMNRQFTSNEWSRIKEPISQNEQLTNFYRFWCLKESYVKALGVGIGFSLQRLDFCPQSELVLGHISTDTRVYVDGELQRGWSFQETMLDEKHVVAVAIQASGHGDSGHGDSGHGIVSGDGGNFKELSFEELVDGAQPLTDIDYQYWEDFDAKLSKPDGKS